MITVSVYSSTMALSIFKEADEGRCFDVRSGNEVIIGEDKIIMTLED